MSTKEDFSFVLNEEEYSLSTKTEKENIIIESKKKEDNVPFGYQLISDLEKLKKENKIFEICVSNDEVKSVLDYIASKKENIEAELENETMKITFNFEVLSLKRKIELNLKEKIYSEKGMIKYLKNKSNLFQKENKQLKDQLKDQFKDIIISNNLSFEETKINSVSSLIKNEKEYNLIKSGIKDLNNKKVELKLLYKASKDGDSPEIFHSKCDGKGPTITIFKTKNNYIFGGYTDVSWDSESKNRPGKNTFLFSFNNMKIYPGVNGGSIFCHKNVGPRFSYALGADKDFLKEEQNNQTEYQNMKKNWENFEKEYELTGEKIYYLTEIEVFHLEFKN